LYPAALDYVAPTSVASALSALVDGGEDAKIISGGQSLIPLLRLRFAAPSVLVDVRRLPGMRGISVDAPDLVIGALTRHADVLSSPHTTGRWAFLRVAASQIADPQVRNLGTLGGALAHADPEGDWASVMLSASAEVTLVSPRGTRVVPVREFLLGMFTTVLEPDEILTTIRLPGKAQRLGGDYQKLSRRVGDFASVGVAVVLGVRERGLVRKQTVIEQAGISLTAVGPINTAVPVAEDLIIGEVPSTELFKGAAELVARGLSPHDDARGSADYKRAVVRAYVVRGLQNAFRTAA
jgi:carbon-monoxide dehydrogenase medium subunit